MEYNRIWKNRVKNNLGLSALSEQELEKYKQIRITIFEKDRGMAKVLSLLMILVLLMEGVYFITPWYDFDLLDAFLIGFVSLALILFLSVSFNPQKRQSKIIKRMLKKEQELLAENPEEETFDV